ncbi:hypothetical protein [Legionella sp. km772]|uniref:hypothetical protein n=1 Tax=Legionella sp. km772 TaxID=2498111 RepID=UPI000F8EC850|nr:hypothetical protein [Legionella sp. km772]RUR13739.1 hypothetical protein ELY15_01540 [Legionella sp. km772]
MNNIKLILSSFLLYSISFAANTDLALPPNAVKVTKVNNPNCVEYYNYKGTLYCSLMTIDNKPMDPKLLAYEKQKITFDNRVWKAVWGEHKDAITTIEYLPMGQNINHWNELITSQFIPGLEEVSAKEFANRFLSNLKKTGVLYKSNFIDKQPKMVIFEYQVMQPKNLQQDELQKIVKGSDGIYVLHYATKKSDMGSKNRQKWLTLLKNSTLKN